LATGLQGACTGADHELTMNYVHSLLSVMAECMTTARIFSQSYSNVPVLGRFSLELVWSVRVTPFSEEERATPSRCIKYSGERVERLIDGRLGFLPLCTCSCIGPSERMRQRVEAVWKLEPPTEQLPALSCILTYTKPAFQKLLGKVQSGAYKSRPSPSKDPEAVIRVQHPGLWRQL
jgi:hypothetical protein